MTAPRGWDCHRFYSISNSVLSRHECDGEVGGEDEQRSVDEGKRETIPQSEHSWTDDMTVSTKTIIKAK